MRLATGRRMAPIDSLQSQLDRLTHFDPGAYPIVSLYLNLQADDRGRDRFETFLKTVWPLRVRTYPADGPERQSLAEDEALIRAFLADVDPAANGLALFACSGSGLFEAMPLLAPVPEHELVISDQPHLYTLARVLDAFPRYAVVVADTHTARVIVLAVNAVERSERVENRKTKRHKMGGWSQARFQRHVDHFREQHAKEVIDALARVVRDEGIESIIIGGDEVIVPLLEATMPKDLADRLVDVIRLDIRTPEHLILRRTLDVMRQQDATTDRDRVAALFDAHRGGGLATVGLEDTRRALELGQVDELLLTADVDTIRPAPMPATAWPEGVGSPSLPPHDGRPESSRPSAAGTDATRADDVMRAADALIVQARQTAASIRFIEDPDLLKGVGGVGALLRFAARDTGLR
ncbi:MAG: Vms1/Ankzf1 family peptidyl-tRNA hydrolase [Vicinamibacterales bacterium]